MNEILDDFKLVLDDLLEVKIAVLKNSGFLDDHEDFSAVTKLYMMNKDIHDTINDIFSKLFPTEVQWGCQTILTAWQNIFNENFHDKFYRAFCQHYNEKNIAIDLTRLRMIADEVKGRYKSLLVA